MNRSRDRRSDEELVERCNFGTADEAAQAFEVLYNRHRDFVMRIAMRFAHDREIALDALQETFTYLLRKFPPTGSGLVLTARLQTLLYPVAKNCAISALRKADRGGRSSSTDLEPDDIAADGTEVVDTVEHDVLETALAGLTAERREVLLLRFVDDLSLAEIAERVGVPLGTVKSRLHLAIKQLRGNPKIKELFE